MRDGPRMTSSGWRYGWQPGMTNGDMLTDYSESALQRLKDSPSAKPRVCVSDTQAALNSEGGEGAVMREPLILFKKLDVVGARQILESTWKLRGSPELWYQVNYRLGGAANASAYKKRYDALTDLIERLSIIHIHTSTSTYIVKTRDSTAQSLLDHLKAPLDPSLDGLHVIEVDPSNRAEFP